MRGNQENEAPLYATLRYEVLKKLNVSASEYMLLDMVYHLSAKYGYCYKTVSSIASDLNLTFTGTKKMIKRLTDRELLVVMHSGLQCAPGYIDIAYLGKHVEVIETELSSKTEQSSLEQPPKSELSSKKVNLVQKTELSSDKNYIRNTEDLQATNNNGPTQTELAIADTILAVVLPKPGNRSNQSINEMFLFWLETVGYPIEGQVKKNRFACSNLLKKHGEDGLKKLINGVALAKGEQYAPDISDFCELQAKANKLLSWGHKRNKVNSGGVVAI